MVWRLVREELEGDVAFSRLERGAVVRQLLDALGAERFRRGCRLVADGYLHDDDPLARYPVCRLELRDLLRDVQPFSHVSEDGVLAVERGLIGDADEELRP